MKIMINKYLVILSCHVNSQEKLDHTIEKIKRLRSESVHVCVSTHSNKYLSDISEYANYVIYEDDNSGVSLDDYLKNAHLIDPSKKWGSNMEVISHSFGRVVTKFPSATHTKPVLSILRSGTIISYFNNYKWTVYMEYDFPEPITGYSVLIEDHIMELEEQGKKCFYIEKKNPEFSLMWGQFLIFQTDKFFLNEQFFNGKWQRDTREFIKEWGVNFAESIVLKLFHEVYCDDEILVKKGGSGSLSKYWKDGNVFWLNIFDSGDALPKDIRELKIYLVPESKVARGGEKMYLYVYNRNNFSMVLDKIIVSVDGTPVIEITDDEIGPDCWYLRPLDIVIDHSEPKLIGLLFLNGGSKVQEVSFSSNNFYSIRDNLMCIELYD